MVGDVILNSWGFFFWSICEYSKDENLQLTKSMLNNLSSDTRPVIILKTISVAFPSKNVMAMSGSKQSTSWDVWEN